MDEHSITIDKIKPMEYLCSCSCDDFSQICRTQAGAKEATFKHVRELVLAFS